jgi:hypothetical protein
VSERIEKVIVRIEVVTNKGTTIELLKQSDDETNKEFRRRVDVVLELRMDVS